MTAIAALALTNNAAATVTFAPMGIDPSGVARWATADAVYDARKTVTMSVTLPKNGSQVVRVKQKISIPVMDTVDANKKIAEAYVNLEFVLPKQASQTVRLDLRKFADTLVMHAASLAAIDNFESIY